MSNTYNRRINLYINGKEVANNVSSIRKEMYKLTNEQARMTLGSEEYNAKAKEIRNLKGILDNHQAQLRGTASLWQKMGGIIKSALPIFSVGAIVGGIGAMAQKMNQAAEAADNFKERLDNLSALTGLEGSELEKLGNVAKKTSVKITDGNVRIKQSADDIVDAYKKVGSQRPELLKNAEALAAVTEDAIILSEAAKSELEPAVAGLTTIMNQFNLGASESRRIINAMAAGSKEGAADIPYLTQAVEKSGTTLKLMNVSLEENIGLVESIAPYYAKAEMAGNSLDKVFLKLKEKQIGYVDGTFSVNAALEELEKRYKRGETAASIFGVEHSKMGELLVQNKDEFNRYTKAVTGTNVAIEQAAKNTNNAKAIQAQARNEFHLAAIELGEKLSPAMTAVYQMAGKVASAFTRMIGTKESEKLRENRIEMNNLFTAIKHTKEGTDERKKAIEQLNTTYGQYLPYLLTEQSSLLEIEKAQRGANTEILKNIQLKLKQEDLEDLARRQKSIMDNILKDVKKQRGESLAGPAESEIFTLLDEMSSMSSLDEAKNRLGAFAKVYRNASQNIGTYSENIQQFFELLQIQKDQEGILSSINKIGLTPPPPPPPGDNGDGGSGGSGGSGNFEKIKKSVETAFNKEQNLLKDQFLQKKLTKKEYDDEMYALEMAPLMAMRELYKKHGEDFVSIEGQIIDKKIAWAEQFNKMMELSKSVTEKLLDDERTMFADIASDMDKYMDDYQQKLDKSTEATIEAEEKKTEAREKAKEAAIISAVESGAAAVENAETIEEAGKAILNTIRNEIKAHLAKALATIVAKALIKVPFPFNIAIAAAAGGAANVLFNKLIPKFAGGGYTNGPEMYIAGEAGTEWIAPNWMTTHPATAQMISTLEKMRQTKTVLSPAVQQFASGGYTSTPTYQSQSAIDASKLRDWKAATPNDVEQNKVLKDLAKAVNELKNLKVYASIEDIRKADKNFTNIQNTRGL